jgi:hypothetical protein
VTPGDLDSLVRAWAARRTPSEEHARELADRIHGELPRGRLLALGDGPPTPPALRLKLRYAALGAVGALLAAGCVLLLIGQRLLPARDAAACRIPEFTKSEIAAKSQLFREIESLFADQLRWVEDSAAGVRLGIAPAPGGAVADPRPILIRVVVVCRSAGERSWRKLLATDVLAHCEEVVETPPDAKLANRLSVWAYPLQDGLLAVDSRIRLVTPLCASANVSAILTPGKPTQVLSVQTDEAEYRVFQMAVPLGKSEDVGG